jgi:hypothetical protein
MSKGIFGLGRKFVAELSHTGSGKIQVGDVDIAPAVRGFKIDGDVRDGVHVSLELAVFNMTEVKIEKAQIYLGRGTEELLLDAGWLPPTADVEGGDLSAQLQATSDRAKELVSVLDEVLRTFVHPGHPGRPCVQSGWVEVERVGRWRDALRGAETAARIWPQDRADDIAVQATTAVQEGLDARG